MTEATDTTTEQQAAELAAKEAEAKAAEDAKAAAEKEAADKAAAEEAEKAKAAEGEKPKEEDKPKDDDDKPLNIEEWGTTNSEVGDSVLRLLQNSGVTTEEAAAMLSDAVIKGDASLIDRAKLEAKIGKTKAELVLAGAKNYITEFNTKTAELASIVHTAVGGEENWKTLRDWANKNIPAKDMSEYVEMLNAGGRRAKLAAQDLNARYEEAGNTSLSADNSTVVPNGEVPKPTQEALSRKDYYERVNKLEKEGKMTDQLRQSLWAARERGIKKGI